MLGFIWGFLMLSLSNKLYGRKGDYSDIFLFREKALKGIIQAGLTIYFDIDGYKLMLSASLKISSVKCLLCLIILTFYVFFAVDCHQFRYFNCVIRACSISDKFSFYMKLFLRFSFISIYFYSFTSELLLKSLYSFTHCRVPVILYTIISSALQSSTFRDLSPSISVYIMQQEQDPIFIFCPTSFIDIRIQVIVPSLTTLFSMPSWDVRSNSSPIFRAKLTNKLCNQIIFLLSPWAFGSFRPRVLRRRVLLLKIVKIIILQD